MAEETKNTEHLFIKTDINAIKYDKLIGKVGMREFSLLMAIGSFADDSGQAYPSIPTLAEICMVSERTIERILKSLRAYRTEDGNPILIVKDVKKSQFKESNTYYFSDKAGIRFGSRDKKKTFYSLVDGHVDKHERKNISTDKNDRTDKTGEGVDSTDRIDGSVKPHSISTDRIDGTTEPHDISTDKNDRTAHVTGSDKVPTKLVKGTDKTGEGQRQKWLRSTDKSYRGTRAIELEQLNYSHKQEPKTLEADASSLSGNSKQSTKDRNNYTDADKTENDGNHTDDIVGTRKVNKDSTESSIKIVGMSLQEVRQLEKRIGHHKMTKIVDDLSDDDFKKIVIGLTKEQRSRFIEVAKMKDDLMATIDYSVLEDKILNAYREKRKRDEAEQRSNEMKRLAKKHHAEKNLK